MEGKNPDEESLGIAHLQNTQAESYSSARSRSQSSQPCLELCTVLSVLEVLFELAKGSHRTEAAPVYPSTQVAANHFKLA